jgi:hypothetical protein
LRDSGLVREAAGRGLIVSPLDVDFVRNLYEIRAMLDGLAGRLAATRGAERARLEGTAYLDADGDEDMIINWGGYSSPGGNDYGRVRALINDGSMNLVEKTTEIGLKTDHLALAATEYEALLRQDENDRGYGRCSPSLPPSSIIFLMRSASFHASSRLPIFASARAFP